MTTGATGQLGLALPVQGELSGTWGDTVNNGLTQYINIAIAGTLTLTDDGAVTLANTTGDASASNVTSTLTGAGTVTAQFAIVRVTGTLTTAKVVTGPSYSKTYTVVNAATGGIVTFKASGQTGVSVAVGETAFVYFNGTDYVKVVGTATAGAAGGSNTQVQFNSSGILAGSANMTFNGTTLTVNDLTDSSLTATRIVFAGTAGNLTDSANLTWNGTSLSATQIDITAQGPLRLQDTTGGEYVGLRSPASLGASYTLTFPADDGTSGQALITDGSGVLSWSTAASGDVYGPASSTDNAVARFDSTTGKLLQNSVVLIGDTGAVTGVTDLSASGAVTLSGGTANGVTYLNGSKVLTSGTALTYNGTVLYTNGKIGVGETNPTALVEARNTSIARMDADSSAVYFGSGNNYPVVFKQNDTEGMRLTSSSLYTASGINVGIGTSSPSGKLDVVLADNGNIDIRQSASASTGFLSWVDSDGERAGRISYDHSSNALRFATAASGTATEKMRLDSAGNLGLGVAPSAWRTDFNARALQLNNASFATFNDDSLYVAQNSFLSATGWKYISTNAATTYVQNAGTHSWNTAASGTAGNAVSFTQAATLDANGNFLVGTTSGTYRCQLSVANGANRDVFAAQVLGASNGLTIKWNHATTTTRVNISNLPTSATGLASGDLYVLAGALMVA
jgi:hypothetical protein